MTTALLWLVSIVLVLAGIAGTVVPGLPGPLLVFAGLLLASWAEGFAHAGGAVLGLLAALALIAHGLDLVASLVGTRRLGASRRAIAGAAVGLLVGLPAGLPGLIAGPFAGAFIAEYTVRRSLAGAGRAGLGAWIGLVLGMLGKVIIVFVMIGIFVAARFR